MDATRKAIDEARRHWDEAPKATVTDIREYRREKQRREWMRKHTRPMPPAPRGAA